MGARSGNNYLSTLKKLGAEVWFEGGRVANVVSHEVLASRARSIASLYDLQMEKPEVMTFRTSDGGRAGMSFVQPRRPDEVRKRGRMMKVWADYSCGTISDSPDVANVALAAMSAAKGFFAESDRRYGENIESYYREAGNHDWCICVALQDADASAPAPETSGSAHSLRMVEQTREGFIVDGRCWAGSLLPACEELLVLPSRFFRQQDASPFASAFAIPSNTRGLKLLTSKSSSRFAGPNCIASFENLLVPSQRVFLFDDIDRARAFAKVTGVTAHRAHQTAVRSLATGEFMVGLAVLVAEAANIISDEAVSGRIADMAAAAARMSVEIERAEADAQADRWGILAPVLEALEQCVAQASSLQSQLTEIVRLTSPSAAAALSLSAHEITRRDLEIALEIARSAGNPHDATTHQATLKPIVERVREFIARLD